MFLETISLILKHSDISTDTTAVSASSSAGSWSNGKQKTTWNVNLRRLLGNQIYDENDLFVLRLNQVSYATANFALGGKDTQNVINVSGFNFSNSTYDVRTGNNSARQQLLLINLATTSATLNISPNVAMCNFRKSNDNIEFTIELIRTLDNLPAEYGAVDKFPHMCYSFDIYAVK